MVKKTITIDGVQFSIKALVAQGNDFQLELEREGVVKQFPVTVISSDAHENRLVFELANKCYAVRLLKSPDHSSLYFFKTKKEFQLEVSAVQQTSSRGIIPAVALLKKQDHFANSASLLKSPLGGRVIKVLVSPGQAVSVGQPLVTIESMKMENEICAAYDAVVKTLSIEPGNLVQPNEVLITFEKKGDGDAAAKSEHGKKEVQNW